MIGHDYRPNKKISLIGLTHTLELRVALTHNNKKNFCFQLNYRKWLSMWEWTTPTLLTLDMWLNQSTISFFLGRWGIDENEYFLETITPAAPQQPLQPRLALRSIVNPQNSRQLFDWKFFCKYLMFEICFVLCKEFLRFHFNYKNRQEVQCKLLKNN